MAKNERIKPIFFTLLFSLLFPNSLLFADSPNHNSLLESLLKCPKNIAFVSWQKEPFFSTGDASFDTYPQNIIKSGNGLYAFINGSGKLYKISNAQNGLDFNRIDSTAHFGYNIGSFGFSYNNRLYNLGGYGFWRMNGQLRVFNEKESEWDIVKLNKEIPLITGITEGAIWYDFAGKKIYTAYYLTKDEAIKTKALEDTKFIYEVMVLDLQKNEWTKLGDLSPYLKAKLQILKPITMSPWGEIVTIGDKISLLDFKNNKILALDVQKDFYQTLSRSFWGNSFYFADSTLYIGNKDRVDSIAMHYSDFIYSNELLYQEQNILASIKSQNGFLIYVLPILALGISAFAWYKFRSPNTSITTNTVTLKETSEPKNVFDEMEIQLLQLLIQNTAAGTPTSTEEQNKILGLTKKSTEIQKKQRSDIIISINSKYAFVTKIDSLIIQRKRTDFDGRAYEYFIEYARLDEISDFLKTKHK